MGITRIGTVEFAPQSKHAFEGTLVFPAL